MKEIGQIEADNLVSKIEDEFEPFSRNKYAHFIKKIREPELIDKKKAIENITILKQAIESELKVSFNFNGYSINKKLETVGTYVISPYYIATSSGRYYLFGCVEGFKEYSIWRIDLMSAISVLYNKLSLPQQNVKNLRDEITESGNLEKFLVRHINMSFDAPELITLKIKRVREKADFTFLHDWFGNTFEVLKFDNAEDEYDLVRVKCSPFGMVNWALQYSDRVEIIRPKSVRDSVINKIKN